MNIKRHDKLLSEVPKNAEGTSVPECNCGGKCDECTCGKNMRSEETAVENTDGSEVQNVDVTGENPDIPYLNLPWGFLSMLSEDDITASLGIQLQNFIWTLNNKYLLQMANIAVNSIGMGWSRLVRHLEDNLELSTVLSAKDELKLSFCVQSMIEELLNMERDMCVMLLRIIVCYVVVTERPQNIDMYPFNSNMSE